MVILHRIFGISEPQVNFDIFLHFGSLLSILVFFHKDILALFKKDRQTLSFIIAASLPTFIIAMLFKDLVEKFFGLPKLVGLMLILTGLWLVLTSWYAAKAHSTKRLGLFNSIIIGIAQGVAIIPGISRSGSTIATGILAGLEPAAAVRFSFLLGMPAILGANLIKSGSICKDLFCGGSLTYLVGGITSAIVGLVAIKILLNLVKNNKLYLFGLYCLAIGSMVIIFI